MKIILINNASFSDSKIKGQNEIFLESAKKLGIDLKIMKNIDIDYYYDSDGVHVQNLDCDAILFYDKDITLARVLTEKGYRLFNSAECVKNCDNKALTYKILSDSGLPMPKTFIFPLLFFPKTENNLIFADKLERELGFPLIAKKWFGSEGQQVFLIGSRQELLDLIEREKQELLFQEYFSECYGSDIRINLIGKEPVACLHRMSKTDFRANLSNGGTAEKYQPTESEVDLARRASDALGCDFCGVDILQTNRGAVICEVNSNPQLSRSVFEIVETNIADAILSYIVDSVKK